MKITCFILLLFSYSITTSAQQTTANCLDSNQVETIFTQQVKKELSIRFPIFRVYEYSDKLGKHYLVLTENEHKKEGDKTFNDSIKAFSILVDSSKYKTEWVINDFIDKTKEEKSIWFWTKYIELKDVDGDRVVEPIVFYGTTAMNGYSDGRLKILVYYKNKKSVIRHQNGILDFERKTQVDKSFYELPYSIQERVKAIMPEIKQCIFPSGWEKAMFDKKLEFSEK